MRRPWVGGLTAAWIAVVSSAHAAQGVLLRDESLRAAASATAAVTGQAARGSVVEVLARQGGWMQVRTNGRTGWVRMLSVRLSEGGERVSGADLAGVVGLGTRQADPSRVVAVAGMRGLTEQELRAARFNAEELARLDGYAVGRAEAEAFAREEGLAPRALAYLPAPARNRSRVNTWEEPQP
ncbi:MAG: SH3 domain-containing protein [Burkholderiales bacterium]|nr:SH3 domain-containing protein [Burkholderiales bacterium]